MKRIGIVASRERLAAALERALAVVPDVERCERTPRGQLPAPGLRDWLAAGGFDVVVYAPAEGLGARPGPSGEIERQIGVLLAHRPAHLVVVSSAVVYGAHHQHVGLLTESRPVGAGANAITDAWVAFERAVTRQAAGATRLAVLRPAAVLDGEHYIDHLLAGTFAVTLPGHNPTIQVLDPEDLARAVAAVVSRGAEGVFNVASDDAVPLPEAVRIAGARRLPLPRLAQTAARAVLAPAGLAAPADHLRFLRYSWTISGRRAARELGFVPRRSSIEAIRARFPRAASAPRAGGYDPFGMDAEYIDRYGRSLFRWMHEYYWRVEVQGLEHLPRTGGVVLAGVHRGFMPFDGVMALHAIRRATGRIPRFLIHPSLTKFPFLADFMSRLGGVMACQENADWVLEREGLLGVYPEGIRGAFTMYRRAYRLGRFGRDEFVRIALRHRAPIVPFVTVGSAEIYPILGRIDWAWFTRYTEWPFLPITASPVPLPSKWHTQFLAPIETAHVGPGALDDPSVVRAISQQVRHRMDHAIHEMLRRRKSAFVGSIFQREGMQ